MDDLDDQTFDRVMTTMKPKLLRLAQLESSRGDDAEIRRIIVGRYVRARIETKNESLDDAIDAACRQYKISDRTARTAWSWTVLHKRPKP
jgi:hypothetical protein